MREFIVTLLLLSLAPSLWAADACRKQGVGLYIDQDLLVPFTNQDRDYTMGVALEFFHQQDGVFLLDQGVDWVVALADELGLERSRTESEHSVIVGTVTYTPDELADPAPIYDDRPYASLIYLGNKQIWTDQDTAVGIELQVGLLGTGIAREVQRNLHRWYREATDSLEPVDPKGWNHQISNGGEPTARLRLAKSARIDHQTRLWDLSYTWDMSLGYQTNASLGITGRLGRPGHAFWSVPFDPINRGNFLPSFDDEWYVWGAYRARLVGYDALLQGQFRDSDVTFDGNDLERLVHEGAVGVTWAWKPVQLTLSVNAKSAELKAPVTRRTHIWGGIYSMWRF